MSLRSPSDTTTVTVPAGAWSGAPAGDWLVVRLDPQPATGVSGGFQSASEVLNVTAYWALNGGSVTSFDLPLEIEVDNTTSNVIPAVFENGSWRTIAEMPGASLPAAWNDGFERDGSNIRIHTRHLSIFTLLKDVQAPTVPGGFKGVLAGKNFSLSWTAATDNSGLVSAYRVYANGVLLKTVDGAARTAAMGALKLTDKRGFQVAAVDEAGNAGAKTKVLKIVPKLAMLKMTAAMKALKARGFKLGRISYKVSKSVPKGKVIKGSVARPPARRREDRPGRLEGQGHGTQGLRGPGPAELARHDAAPELVRPADPAGRLRPWRRPDADGPRPDDDDRD